ncbi:GGDEF domain-containing protein [Comamonas guangdongensis]|uniref:diguanylate cyclase n=1 Tax=Comamonas guangdongensis TaxID=510515 RepID=A0ABV3ZPT1_9BURK
MLSNNQLYVLVAPACITALGGLLGLCWLIQRRSLFLLWTACGLVLTGIGLSWQSIIPKAELSRWAVYTGAIYLAGAWFCTLGVAHKFSVSAFPKTSAVVSALVLAILYQNSAVQDSIAVRTLWLNLGLGIIHFLPFPAIVRRPASKDRLERLLYWSYGLFAIYTMLRPAMVLVLGFTELKDMTVSIYWLVTMLGSLLFSLLFSGLLLIVAMRDATLVLRDERNHDSLTGLLNRRAFWEAAEKLNQQPGVGPVSILIGDIDHFKQVNDNWGHEYGDMVLKAVARAMLESVRSEDLVARFGGEEFVLLLTRSDLETAEQVAQRIRAKVSASGYVQQPGQGVTMSFGVASLAFDANLRQVVSAADRLLYQAKESGRDQVAVEPLFAPVAMA